MLSSCCFRFVCLLSACLRLFIKLWACVLYNIFPEFIRFMVFFNARNWEVSANDWKKFKACQKTTAHLSKKLYEPSKYPYSQYPVKRLTTRPKVSPCSLFHRSFPHKFTPFPAKTIEYAFTCVGFSFLFFLSMKITLFLPFRRLCGFRHCTKIGCQFLRAWCLS